MLPLEKALFGVSRVERDDCIVARHYGFDGRGGADFQRTGNEFGLTRERVRQIILGSDPLCQLPPDASLTLDRAIASITDGLPAPAADVERNLFQVAGRSTEPFRIEGIFNVAGLLGRPLSFRIDTWNKTRFIVPASWPRLRDFLARARGRVRRHGMARIADFGSDPLSAARAQREAGLMSAILSSQSDFRWLDRGSGWFWFAGARNRAVVRVRKMLAVANPLGVSELSAGLGRMGSPLAPEGTLLALCRQIDGLAVRGDMICANPGIESAEVLNKTERDLFQLLSENDGCMSNSELISQCSVLGMKRPTFYQCVTHSPIVARYNGSSYRLIGSQGQNAQAVKPAAATV